MGQRKRMASTRTTGDGKPVSVKGVRENHRKREKGVDLLRFVRLHGFTANVKGLAHAPANNPSRQR